MISPGTSAILVSVGYARQSGQRLSGGMGALPGDSIPLSNLSYSDRKRDSVLVLRTHPVRAVVFSPSMIADVQANRERLSLTIGGCLSQSRGSKVKGGDMLADGR